MPAEPKLAPRTRRKRPEPVAEFCEKPPVPPPPRVRVKRGSSMFWWFRRTSTFLFGLAVIGAAGWLALAHGVAIWAALIMTAGGLFSMSLALVDKPYWAFQSDNRVIEAKDYQDVFTHTKAVGVTYANRDGSSRQQIVKRLLAGETLVLIWDRWNRFSPHALALLRLNGEQVGYMADEMAADFCPHVRRGVAYHVWVKSVTGVRPRRNHGVNIGIDELDPGSAEARSVLWWASVATWRWRNRLPNRTCRWLLFFGLVALAAAGFSA